MNNSFKNPLVLGAKSDAPRSNPIDISQVKPTLFNKEKKYNRASNNFLDKVTRVLGVAVVSIALLMTSTFFNLGKVPIPSTDQVYKNLDTVGIGTEIVTKVDSGILSRFITEEGESIKVGISDEFSAEEKQVIKECLDVYNNVFSVINPDYKFEVDDETSNFERMDPNYIQVKTVGELDGDAVAFERSGQFPTIKGLDTTYNQIFMGSDSRQNINMFRHTFLHEFMHALGVADAYLVENFYVGTIMNCTATNTKTNDIYKYDVALLAALYGDFSNEESVQKIIDFINNYGANSSYTDTSYCKYPKSNKSKRPKIDIKEDEEGLAF